MLDNVLTINNSNNSIQSSTGSNIIVNKESLGYWGRISHACGLDDNCIKSFFLLNEKPLDNLGKVTSNSATDTTIYSLDQLVL